MISCSPGSSTLANLTIKNATPVVLESVQIKTLEDLNIYKTRDQIKPYGEVVFSNLTEKKFPCSAEITINPTPSLYQKYIKCIPELVKPFIIIINSNTTLEISLSEKQECTDSSMGQIVLISNSWTYKIY